MAVTPKEIDMKMKLVVLASASRALEYKRKNPAASDEEVLRFITKTTNDIINESY